MKKQPAEVDINTLKIKLGDEVKDAQSEAIAQMAEHAKDPDAEYEDVDAQELGEEEGNVRARKSLPHVPAPMRINKNDGAQSLSAALAMRPSVMAALAKRRTGGMSHDPTRVYYVRCKDEECLLPGIWLETPNVALTDTNWWSSYKPRGSYWSPEKAPHCQCCYERALQAGIKRPLRKPLGIDFQTVGNPGKETREGLLPNPRYVGSLPRTPADKTESDIENNVPAYTELIQEPAEARA